MLRRATAPRARAYCCCTACARAMCHHHFATCPETPRTLTQYLSPVPRFNHTHHAHRRAAIDSFNLTLPNIGTLKRILIGHDNSNPGAAWHLKAVGIIVITADPSLFGVRTTDPATQRGGCMPASRVWALNPPNVDRPERRQSLA